MGDTMTRIPDPDRRAPLLPFAPGDLDRCGVRMNRADFARFLGVSKQTVGDWVRAGKVTLGADGLLDPRQAVQQLLRTTDPARLRSKVLAPLVRDMGTLQRRVAELEAALATAREDAEFHEGAAGEMIEQINALLRHFRDDWIDLHALPPSVALAAIDAWESALNDGRLDWNEVSILDFAPAPQAEGEGLREAPSSAPIAAYGEGV